MAQNSPRLSMAGNKLRVVVVVAIGLWFSVRYAQGILAVTDSQHALSAAQSQVADAKSRQEWLKQRLEYVKTDAYVESAAREDLLMVKPGDVSVKVIPNHSDQTTQSQPASAGPTETRRPIEQWRDLFFGPPH